MELSEFGKNNGQPDDDLTPEEQYAKGLEKDKAGDSRGALAWFEKAAAQGHVAAQEHLDDMQKYKMTQSRYDELQKELDCCRPQPMVWAAGNADILA